MRDIIRGRYEVKRYRIEVNFKKSNMAFGCPT
jgi:hypothetical protein